MEESDSAYLRTANGNIRLGGGNETQKKCVYLTSSAIDELYTKYIKEGAKLEIF